MDTNSGKIYYRTEEEIKKLDKEIGKTFIPIDKNDMTSRQKKEMKVSKFDGRSKLGQLRQSNIRKIGRNSPCPCGSGRKYKKCCLSRDKNRKEFS